MRVRHGKGGHQLGSSSVSGVGGRGRPRAALASRKLLTLMPKLLKSNGGNCGGDGGNGGRYDDHEVVIEPVEETMVGDGALDGGVGKPLTLLRAKSIWRDSCSSSL